MGLGLINARGFERFIVIQFEVDLSFDQFLKVVLNG
jgi:hypothetical protein